MLQYDLTGTQLFDAETRLALPTDGEIFALTAALLLTHDIAYHEVAHKELALAPADVENIAQCIEYRLPVFTRDLGCGHTLRHRLQAFVGLRIAGVELCPAPQAAKPT